ncbi:NUDIX domain-containing protein [Candidatus Woesearchaeota archaeon]|nr:NUDIX domain-containing protein [Candidatus Woesearchaeota archaeon]
MIQEKSAGLILFRIEEGKPCYLLLHYAAGHWDYVKGHVEKNETVEQAALREAREEAGLKHIGVIPGFQESINYYYRKGKELMFKEVVFFVGMTKTSKIVLSHEHTDFAWKSYEEALKLVTFETAKEVLKKAHKFIVTL